MMVFFYALPGIFSHWGAVYSVDAFRAKRAPDPGSKNWVYFWPARTMIVLLAFLYFSAGYYKVVHPAGWLQDPDFLALPANQTHAKRRQQRHAANPLATWIAQYDILTVTGQYAILAFELTFPVVLISTAAYLLYMRLVPFFHFLNAFLLGIPFLPILAAYIFIFDWKNLADATPLNVDRFRQFPLKTWQALPIAALPALLWNTTPVPRFLFGGFGLFEGNRSVWYVLLPVILLWYAYNLVRYWRGRSAPHAAPAVPQAD